MPAGSSKDLSGFAINRTTTHSTKLNECRLTVSVSTRSARGQVLQSKRVSPSMKYSETVSGGGKKGAWAHQHAALIRLSGPGRMDE